ncbi:ATP-dependent helicase [Paenibacillus thalictri]|uniref:DNA 3'-5' helicase n=1 Tax=Paenibacillus thalictri TaxID=2527873 RepID=A0A4V2J3N5_9BACL|nr:ATP-dependent helicase [Paenibacillus thalictri]TBL74024.1 ATP-dependent helicase [Paenibacillus thalictri]
MHIQDDFFARKKRELGVSLNRVQKQAVLHTDGALLLLASPGAGKTTTIIMRIGYLIEHKGVHPARIKAVTFSRASAADMKARFARFFPDQTGAAVDFSTIHSFAFEVVRSHFWKSGTTYRLIEGDVDIEDEEQPDGGTTAQRQAAPFSASAVSPSISAKAAAPGLRAASSPRMPSAPGRSPAYSASGMPLPPLHKKFILRHLYKEMTGENITDDQMDDLTTYISYVKNKLLPEARWPEVKCDVPDAESILRRYEHFKRTASDTLLLDYDDMLTIANEALHSDAGLLRKYQARYDYLLTDESQDTSLVQHAIVEKLVHRHGNLCVVADDDQSIYTWRAAEPQYLLDFHKVYPQAAIMKLEQNYRSSRNIVDVANRFIKRNKNRFDKNMFTENPPHTPITIKTLADYKYQAKYLAERIAGFDNLREVAVLYRNNSSSIMIMNEFDRAGIPFYMKDGDNRFFSHFVVEDVLNFMRMTFNDRRPDIFEKIHMKMNGYITRVQMAELKQIGAGGSVFDNLLRYVTLQDYQVKQLQEVKETFEQMRGMPPQKAIRYIRYKLGYEKAIDKMCERLGFRREYLLGILNTLEDIADQLETMEDFAARLKHLETVMKTSKFQKHENAVTFSTMHSAKGLEFDRVYMIDLTDGVIPSSDEIGRLEEGQREDMEEAVRLFYVGMTRARQHLELLAYKMKDGAAVKESRFVTNVRHLQEPPQVPVKASAGAQVRGASGRDAGSRGAAVTGRTAPSVSARAAERLSQKAKLLKPAVEYNPDAYQDPGQLLAGNTVKHRVFGHGEIESVGEERIRIRFTQAGVKELQITTCIEMGLLEPGE